MSDIYSVNLLMGINFSGNQFVDNIADIDVDVDGESDQAKQLQQLQILKSNRQILFQQLELLKWYTCF